MCGKDPADTGSFESELPELGENEEDARLGRGTGKGAMVFDKDIFDNAW